MAVLVSPENNTGWGLGIHNMYGGAFEQSESHPVLVRQHYRAKWGSVRRGTGSRRRSRRGRARRAPRVPMHGNDNTIDEAINAVVADARRRSRNRSPPVPRVRGPRRVAFDSAAIRLNSALRSMWNKKGI